MNRSITEGLVGRSFVASTGNVCRIERLGNNAIRAVWKVPSTRLEQDEFNEWAESTIGNAKATVCRDKKDEEVMYREFKKKMKEENEQL